MDTKRANGKTKYIIMICAAALLALIAVCVTVIASGKSKSYNKALYLIESGNTKEAYIILRELGNYKDSGQKAADMVAADPALPYQIVEKGDTVCFGRYEQDNDESNGPEAIEWIVLDRIDDEILLLSVKCLEYSVYNDTAFEPVTWEDSYIRSFLNGEFTDKAFYDEEKALLQETENINYDHSFHETEGGNNTFDHVFLLSEKEAGIYISEEADRNYIGRAQASDYVVASGASVDDEGMAEWFLRSPGEYEYTAQFVERDGNIYSAGAYVDIAYAIRPAIWLNVSK